MADDMRLRADAPVSLALVVRDVEASAAFYRDILGMEEVKRVVVADEKAARGAFSRRGFRFRTFRLGPLALKLVEAKGEPSPTEGLVDSHTGVRYIAFTVEDIDAAAARLRAAGVAFESPILPPEPDEGIGRLVFFRDPDGNLLELYGD